MTDYVRVPREPTEAMLVNGREALLPLVRLDSYGPLIGLWRDMLAASPQGEGSSGDPAPIKPSGDTGELRERVARLNVLTEARRDDALLDPCSVDCYEATVGDLRAILDLIRKD